MSELIVDSPLFIIGNPRSGTSLLRLILTSHSKILIPPECGFIIWLSQIYSEWNQLDTHDSAKRKKYLDDLLACKKFETWGLSREKIEHQIITRKPQNYAQLCAIVYEAYGENIGEKFSIWGDKNNFHIHHLRELYDLYGKARFLHIVRDGRDVACSYREVMKERSNSPYAPKLDTEISAIAEDWSSNVMKIQTFMESIPAVHVMTIRYEDLVSFPESTISSICNWLDVGFESEMLDFYRKNLAKSLEPSLTLDWKKRTMEPISQDTVGRHKNILTDDEESIFLSLADSVLRKFDYQ